jgi:hypothetical protein
MRFGFADDNEIVLGLCLVSCAVVVVFISLSLSLTLSLYSIYRERGMLYAMHPLVNSDGLGFNRSDRTAPLLITLAVNAHA